MIDIAPIAALFSSGSFTVLKEEEHSRGEMDRRYIYLLEFTDGARMAIKIYRNSFTDARRVAAWAQLTDKYRSLGIWCPRFLPSLGGNIAESVLIDGLEHIACAEEMIAYPTYHDLEEKPDWFSIKRAAVEAIGKVAAAPDVPMSWPSAFCVFETFQVEDKTDENYEHAQTVTEKIAKDFPQYAGEAREIFAIYERNRQELEPLYSRLPRVSLQGDLNDSNILIDGGRFAGLIDFNLAGSEVLLSYLLTSEACGYWITDDSIDELMEPDRLGRRDEYLYGNLALIAKHYAFTDFERQHFCLCYNTIYPFSCWMVGHMLDDAKEQNRPECVRTILDWLRYQLTRGDISLDGF